jgi:Protein of unknown function (DUF3866)
VSGRLRLRRGVVVGERPLTVEVDGDPRPAWADTALLGEMREGDEVVVNVAALDLGLGSGGFDVVHVNLTRGLAGGSPGEEPHVMKLNYTSLQHAVEPVEVTENESPNLESREHPLRAMSVLVIPLHGHLAPAAWAAVRERPGLRVGYVQTAGGALPGSLSRDVATLLERELICEHITVAPAYGGQHEALSVAGALRAARGWEAAIVGPGPGIIGSETNFGHGGMAALDNAHAALSLSMGTLLSPRLSSSDPRERHRGLSHHTLMVASMLLAPVTIPIPVDLPEIAAELAAAAPSHNVVEATVSLDAYADTELPARTMGRSIDEDPLFFAAPLAAGRWLGH